MSKRTSSAAYKLERQAPLFAALGDPNRLSLVAKLIDGRPHSISALAEGGKISRQALTKHLEVLKEVGLVYSIKSGRESLYELDTKPLYSLQESLALISSQWDRALQDLKSFVEE